MADVFDKARHVNLPDLAAHLGRHDGSGVTSPCCAGQSVSTWQDDHDVWRWRCDGCSSGGTAIDFVAKERSLPPLRAARCIMAILAKAPSLALPQAARRTVDTDACAAAVAAVLNAERLDGEVVDYLAGRGISHAVTRHAFAEGWLRTLPADPRAATEFLFKVIGRKALDASGLLRKNGSVMVSKMPLIFVTADAGAMEFRAIESDGGPKAIQAGLAKTPIATRVPANADRCIALGSGMEMLAYLELGLADANDVLMGECGAGSWRESWVAWLTAQSQLVTRATIAMTEGQEATRVHDGFVRAGMQTEVTPPPGQGDWGFSLSMLAA